MGRPGALLTLHRAHVPVSRALSVAQGTELGSVGLLWHLLPQPEPHLRLGPVNVL